MCVHYLSFSAESGNSSRVLETSRPSEPLSSPELSPSRGAYDEKYETMQAIGKGAFGFVKTARRRSDNKQVGYYCAVL